MEKEKLVPVDYSNQRVLLTAQLADKYKCKPIQIQQNFNNAKAQFKEGVHYFKLTGEALRSFRLQFDYFEVQISPRARSLYLWTEQGALLHCKMLNTDEAWAVFKDLSNFYFAHRDENYDELKAQIAQLKKENAALKAARPNFKPQPIPMDQWFKSLFGDDMKIEYVDEAKVNKRK